MQNFEPDTIRQAWQVLSRGNDSIREVRIPQHQPNKSRSYSHTTAGYFDNPDKLCSALGKLTGVCPAVYMTLNPVNPDLFARGANRLVEKTRHTTSDDAVPRREWVFIDVDPQRPAGISASDAEKLEAYNLAKRITEHLSQCGMTSYVTADSGNGYHLLLPCALDNTPEDLDLVERFLKGMDQRYSDETIKIDTTVANAARIVKLYGTLSAKGDNIDERPHRMSQIRQVVGDLAPLPREFFEKLALPKEEPKPNGNGRYRGSHGRDFDLSQWVAQHEPNARPKQMNGWISAWLLPVCPFNSQHNNGEVHIGQRQSGEFCFKCKHNSCSDKGWKDYRALREPGCYELRQGTADGPQLEPPPDHPSVAAPHSADQLEIPNQAANNVKPIQDAHPSNPFKDSDALGTMRQMGIGKHADEILSRLDSDVFVFEQMAIRGQTTIIAAPPNAGKTLLLMRFIIDAVSKGSVDPSRVFYLNCDDFPRGQAIKSKILEEWQVIMLAPGWNNFDVMQFYSMLNALVKQGQADGTILILDTLRRFVDTLSHDGVKEFGMFTRKFNSAGGTIVALAHTNKNKSMEGKRVLEGVQGIANDADAVYIGDVQTVEQGKRIDQTVTFEATPDVGGKVRGDNDRVVSYSFTRITGEEYEATLESVRRADEDDVEQQKEVISVLESLRKNEPVFPVIESIIQSGICQMTQVINAAMKELDLPKHTVRTIITTHLQQKDWHTYDQGYRWHARARDPDKPAAKLLTCLKPGQRGVDTLDNRKTGQTGK